MTLLRNRADVMLKFLFKRPGDKSAEAPAASAAEQRKAATAAATAATTKAERAVQAERLASLARDGEGKVDEAAAADFILQCDFSELRLAAAEFLVSRAQLERVHAAIRNTDRRVAKLLQGRLDAIRHHDAEMVRAQACLAQAEALLADDKLSPNQVAELDRRWSVIAAPELAPRFSVLRASLAARLEAQVGLQRAMIDRLAALRKLGTLDAADGDTLAAQFARMSAEQQAALDAPERAALPRALVAEFAAEQARVQASMAILEQDRSAFAARTAALDAWTAALDAPAAPAMPAVSAEAGDAAGSTETQAASDEAAAVEAAPAAAQLAPASILNADTVKREWQRLPQPSPGEAFDALQARFDALLARIPGAPAKASERRARPQAAEQVKTADGRAARPVGGADSAFLDELAAMESALEQGSLHSAADHDKALKDIKGGKLSQAQADRLAHARAELKRLSDWARWGGNVSREELIKAVEQLSTQSLPMAELAKKVGSMRERWKALDTLSGAAPKTLWERFDAACSTAYAPAAAHFKQLSEERHHNAAKAQALIKEAQAQAARIVQDRSNARKAATPRNWTGSRWPKRCSACAWPGATWAPSTARTRSASTSSSPRPSTSCKSPSSSSARLKWPTARR